MPLNLAGAVPNTTYTPPISNDLLGHHQAFFIGFEKPYTEVNRFERCKTCTGTRIAPMGGPCMNCDGTGSKVSQKVNLRYELQTLSGLQVIEEPVTFKLGDGKGVAKDGSTFSPSTMFVRFRALSGHQSVEDIQTWAANLPNQIRIPCSIYVGMNKTNTRAVIKDVTGSGERRFASNLPQPSHGVPAVPGGDRGGYIPSYAAQEQQKPFDGTAAMKPLMARMRALTWPMDFRISFITDAIGRHSNSPADLSEADVQKIEAALTQQEEQLRADRAANAGVPMSAPAASPAYEDDFDAVPF